MKRSKVFLILLVVGLGAVLSVSWAQTAPAPKMVIENSDFDYGNVNEGATVEHAFTVRNQGDAPLEIKKVQPG